jgi:hypothetical protein
MNLMKVAFIAFIYAFEFSYFFVSYSLVIYFLTHIRTLIIVIILFFVKFFHQLIFYPTKTFQIYQS